MTIATQKSAVSLLPLLSLRFDTGLGSDSGTGPILDSSIGVGSGATISAGSSSVDGPRSETYKYLLNNGFTKVQAAGSLYRDMQHSSYASSAVSDLTRILTQLEGQKGAQDILVQMGLLTLPTSVSPSGKVVSVITPTKSNPYASAVSAALNTAAAQASQTVSTNAILGAVAAKPTSDIVSASLLVPPETRGTNTSTSLDSALKGVMDPKPLSLTYEMPSPVKTVDPDLPAPSSVRPIAAPAPTTFVGGQEVPIVGALVTIPPTAISPKPDDVSAAIDKIKNEATVPPLNPPGLLDKALTQVKTDLLGSVEKAGLAALITAGKSVINTPGANLVQAGLDIIDPNATPRVLSTATATSAAYIWVGVAVLIVILMTGK